MGTIVLLIALMAEIAFTACCIVTRSSQEKIRSYIRIGGFVAFVLFTLVSVIRWNITWYLFALLLFVWAVIGSLALVRNKPEKKEYKPGRSVIRAITAMLLIFIAIIPTLIFPQHRSPKITGIHPVTTINYTYVDENRVDPLANTSEPVKVNVEFWYPKNGGELFPLVLFSHGILGTKSSNTSTYMELASNGYVVCAIDHPYNSLFTVDDSGQRAMINNAYLQEYMNVSKGLYDEETSIRLEQKWVGWRVADINFVLDTILTKTKETGSGAVYQMIDPKKIGLMGHSLGGESSAQVARERSDIRAVVNLDSDLADEYVDYVNGKWALNDAPYPVPILNIFSDTLENLMSEVSDPNTIAVKHAIATAPQAYEVHLSGTNHMSFTDLPLISPFLVNLINASVPKAGGQAVDPLATIEKMNDLILKFFNTYLKGEGDFTTDGVN
jgi:predicted dienelactone hydrolase